MFCSNLSAQNGFVLTWDSQVACLEYDDVEKRTALENIEEGKCLKVCEGSVVRYTLFYDDEEQFVDQINWSVQGGEILVNNQNIIQVQWPVAGEDAEVSVEILLADGEVIQATLCVETKPKPEALFEVAGLDNDFFCEDTDLYFNSLSTTTDGSNIVSHIWDFGNGDFSNEENPVYSFDKAGEYEVTLTVRDECNCTNQYTQTINIVPPAYQIECPTVTCEGAIETYFIEINPESQLEEVNCSQFNWSVDGGEIIEQESNWVSVIWDQVDASGFGTVYFDQSNCDVECNSVLAASIPVVLEQGTIQGGNTELCEGEQSVFSLPQWPTTDFQWTLIDEFGTAYPNNTVLVDQRNEIAVDTEGLNSGNYTLKANYTNTLLSCSGNAEIDIKVLENLEIDQNPAVSCIENVVNFQLVNTNATNAQWTIKHLNNTVATGTGNSFDYAFTQTGLHTITVNADGFCDNPLSSSSIEIVDNPSFPSNTEILGEDSMCPNQMLSYTLSNVINEANIIWSVSNGQIVGPHQGDEVSVIFDEGFSNYQVSAQLADPNAENCLSSIITKDIDLFQVDEQIVDNASPPSTGPESYCASSLAEFTLNYQDSDTYVWTFDPPQLATVSAGIGTNNPIILFNEPFTDSSGNYINAGQIIANAKVCGQMQEIDRFDFTLIESPSLTVNMPAEICAGAAFDVDITSSIELPGLSPQDVNISFENNFNNFNDITINSTTSYTIHDIVLNNVDSDIAIGYNISIVNDICNDATASGTITVKPSPVADISLLSGGNTFCQAEDIDAELQVNVQDPNGNQSFQWLFNGSIIQGETSNTIDLSNNNNGFGIYTVQVTGANECVTTTTGYGIFNDCDDNPECEDETLSVDTNWINCNQVEVTATFSNNPNSVTVEPADSFSNANATFDSSQQSSPGQVTYIFNVNTSGSFKFKAQVDYNDCFRESLASVDVGYHPILNTEITCNSNGNAYDVILHNDSTFLPSFNNIDVVYLITNTDTDDTFNTTAENFSQATAAIPPGNYEFTLSIQESDFPLCKVTKQVDLSLPDATFSISNSSPFCTEEQVVLSPTNPDSNVTYQWEFQGATNTLQDIVIQMDANPDSEIKLTATNPYGCSSSFSIENLEVLKAEFSGNIVPQNPLICQGEVANLTYQTEIGGTSPSAHQWVLDGENINGATNATYTASTEGLYSVRLTDGDGCVYNELAGVYVNIAPNPSINIDVNTELCEGEDLIFSGIVSPDNAEYQISVLQNGQPNIVQAWTSGPDISYTETMQTDGEFDYLIEVKDIVTNCETSETISVTVLPSIEPQVDIQLDQCEAYSITLSITNPQPNALYTWSNGMQGTSISVNTGGAYSVTYQPQSGCSTTANVFVPKSPDEFLWIFPEGCIDFCSNTVRFDPTPYIIGPIPEFHPYTWNFNNNSVSQNGEVSDYVINLADGILNLSLTNDLSCVSTSSDLDIDIEDYCDAGCNIDFENPVSTENSNNNFMSYEITGSISNNNNFAITLSLTSYNGVYTPNTITIPANSSVSFNSSNLLTFIPDAGFTGGSDFVQVMGQQAGNAFCVDEIEITYNSSQSRIDYKLKASPNPVTHRTTLFYELLNIDKVENAEIEIYTILGYLKDRRKITNVKDEVLLDLSAYNSGQYIVVLKHGGKILNQLILIKE